MDRRPGREGKEIAEGSEKGLRVVAARSFQLGKTLVSFSKCSVRVCLVSMDGQPRTLDANFTTLLPRSHPSPISPTAGGPTFRKVQKQTGSARRQSGPGCVKENWRSDAQRSTPARRGCNVESALVFLGVLRNVAQTC